MKMGRSLQELAEKVDWHRVNSRDYVADSRALLVQPSEEENDVVFNLGITGVKNDVGVYLEPLYEGTPLAHQQIASAAKIPKAYYDRMRQSSPRLLSDNINHWWKSEPKKRLIRTITPDRTVRAFLSDRYRPLDNFELMEAVLPKFEERGLKMVSCELTDTRLYLKAVSEKMQGEIKVNDPVQAGIVVSNSEVGQGTLRIDEFIYRLVCINGMITGKLVRKTHLGRASGIEAVDSAEEFYRDETRRLDDRAFWAKISDTVDAVFDHERFENRLNKLRETTVQAIEGSPQKAIEVVQRRFGLSEDETDGVMKSLIEGGDLSRWGLANAITHQAESAPSYDRATEFEKFGGDLIELAPSEWRSIATAA
jgi:hypothetical protein